MKDMTTWSPTATLDTLADLDDDACTLMAAENRETQHRMSGHQVVSEWHIPRPPLDLDLVLRRIADLDLLDRPRLVELTDERAFVSLRNPSVVNDGRSERSRSRCHPSLTGVKSPDGYGGLSQRVVPGSCSRQAALDPLLHAGRHYPAFISSRYSFWIRSRRSRVAIR